MNTNSTRLRVPALRISQSPGVVLFTFALDGKRLPQIAEVARVRRASGMSIRGYQRAEVRAHIAAIRNYLESPRAMIPNALVLALDPRTRFVASNGQGTGPVRTGYLQLPRPRNGRGAAWVVDGQQRLAAIRHARIGAFPVCIVGFIAKTEAEQRAQFLLVNSAKPLPPGLINELLPDTTAFLPAKLRKKQIPAHLVRCLNLQADSPFAGRIRTATNPEGVIRDNSLIRMLENSLSDGALYQYCRPGRPADVRGMLKLLKAYWWAVRLTFEDAWDLPPRKSRLMHGAGIVSLGFVMDAVAESAPRSGTTRDFERELAVLRPYCKWTRGRWRFGGGEVRNWDEIQNTSKDIQLVADLLLSRYRAARRGT